jgi:hypothetical protein
MAGEILAFTLLGDGNWVAYVGDPYPTGPGRRVIWNDMLTFPSRQTPAPVKCIFPYLTPHDGSSFLLVDTRMGNQPNASLMNILGQVLLTFAAGDGIEQALCSQDAFVCTYFDEGVYGGLDPSQAGVAVFSKGGNFLTGWHSRFGWQDVSISDCYCACFDPSGRLLFSPYTEFPLVRWDLKANTRQIWQLPESLQCCHALSATDTHTYFWGPHGYDVENTMFGFELRTGEVSVVGELAPLAHRQPLSDGRFLTWDQEQYLVVDPTRP